jgi:hypothetical protein
MWRRCSWNLSNNRTGKAVSVALLVVIPEGDLLLAVAVAVVVVFAVAVEIGPGFSPDIKPDHQMGFSPRDMVLKRRNKGSAAD